MLLQQMAQCVDRHLEFRAALALGAVIAPLMAGSRARRAHCATIDDGHRAPRCARRPALSPLRSMREGLEHAGRAPPLRLLIHYKPWRADQWTSAMHCRCGLRSAKAVAGFTQCVMPLRRAIGHQRQLRRDQGPFIDVDVTGIWLANRGRPLLLNRLGSS